MKSSQSSTWVGIKDLTQDPEWIAENKESEFKELPIIGALAEEKTLDTRSNRRDFLKMLGFSLGAATVAAACDTPVRRAIPYVVKPDSIVPGIANYYASAYVEGGDYVPILVKTREGRPIKIEGNSLSPITEGGTSARAQAYVLSLYDTSRYRGPKRVTAEGWTDTDWATIDADVNKIPRSARIGIVLPTVLSPTARRALADFRSVYNNSVIAQYDPVSSAAQLEVMKRETGVRALPSYHFDKADIIVSFNADFLGTWVSPVEYTTGYIKRRKISDPHHANMSWHVQLESRMSLTGSNADNRILIKPSEQDAAVAYLYRALGGSAQVTTDINAAARAALDTVAQKLRAAAGKSIIISASNNVVTQEYVYRINEMLSNIGSTVDITHPSYQRQGDERSLAALIAEMEAGRVDALMVIGGANPAWDNPLAGAFTTAMSKVPVRISTALAPDETAALSTHIAPTHHGLESWGDAVPKKGELAVMQPTIAPLFNTRQAELSLLQWAGKTAGLNADQPYYDYMRQSWQAGGATGGFSSFQGMWDDSVHRGVIASDIALDDLLADVNMPAGSRQIAQPSTTGVDLEIFETINVGTGNHANNPWLLEMPDPVLRTVWGNYLSVPVSWDGGMEYTSFNNLKDGDYATVSAAGTSHKATVMNGFGQMPGTASISCGLGREVVGPAGEGVGINVNPWIQMSADGLWQYYVPGADISGKMGRDDEFACVQYHHTMGVTDEDPSTGEIVNADEITAPTIARGYQGSLVDRTIIRRSNVRDIDEFVHDLEHERAHHEKLNSYTLYPYEEYSADNYSTGHHWGLHVDLNACTGCGACTVACMAENNIPVVGKKEVHRHHEMSWLRIDRYFYGDINNPNTVYQPMMCQHCDNAPCENVCPVAATNHSSEGLNQMTYNRCIGTRYCANNCPYKVRRFNWLDYTTADLFPINQPALNDGEVFGKDNLTRMVLNPDVTVRSRGVIEKCSFCVQRIQEGKLSAKKEGRAVQDGDIKSACQTACPTGAITFGDFNDKKSAMVQAVESSLTYQVLEEINVRPSVNYSAKINNRDEALDA